MEKERLFFDKMLQHNEMFPRMDARQVQARAMENQSFLLVFAKKK